jgi:hypothetical protein
MLSRCLSRCRQFSFAGPLAVQQAARTSLAGSQQHRELQAVYSAPYLHGRHDDYRMGTNRSVERTTAIGRPNKFKPSIAQVGAYMSKGRRDCPRS